MDKICLICAKEYIVPLYRAHTSKYCSRSCFNKSKIGKPAWNKNRHNPNWTRDKNPRWKGGRKIHAHGYILIASPAHPHKDKQGYVRQHRLIMEHSLGRYLKPSEDVHHLDDNKQNNQIENLELFSNRSEHLKKYHRDGGRKSWFKKGHIPHNKGGYSFGTE